MALTRVTDSLSQQGKSSAANEKRPLRVPQRSFARGRSLDKKPDLCYNTRVGWVCSSVGERFLHTEEVTGSSPVTPTIL